MDKPLCPNCQQAQMKPVGDVYTDLIPRDYCPKCGVVVKLDKCECRHGEYCMRHNDRCMPFYNCRITTSGEESF